MTKPLIATIVFAAIGAAHAQTVVVDQRMGGYAYNSPYNRLYNQGTQITFDGKVSGIERVVPMKDMAEGVTLLVKAPNGGTAVVELGPTWFVDHQETKLHVNDKIQVTGSKIMVDGHGVILAKLVKKGTDVLALRRPSGIPYWDVAQPVAALGPDPNVVEVTGTVTRPITIGNGPTVASGVVLQTDNGLVTIDLGPSWFVQPQGFAFTQPGTNLVVFTGGTFNLSPSGNPIPAYYVRYNGQVYPLRNPNDGTGVWQGWQPPTP